MGIDGALLAAAVGSLLTLAGALASEFWRQSAADRHWLKEERTRRYTQLLHASSSAAREETQDAVADEREPDPNFGRRLEDAIAAAELLCSQDALDAAYRLYAASHDDYQAAVREHHLRRNPTISRYLVAGEQPEMTSLERWIELRDALRNRLRDDLGAKPVKTEDLAG